MNFLGCYDRIVENPWQASIGCWFKAPFACENCKLSLLTKPTFIGPRRPLIPDNGAAPCFEKNGVVEAVEKNKSQEPAPLPFSLSTLQEFANKTWGLEPTQTLAAAQLLYDQGYTTYPRTGCEYIPEAQFSEASEILASLKKFHRTGIASLATNANTSIKSRAFNDKKIDAHFALIPTGKIPEANSISDSLTEIYCAIVQRYILQFYPPEIFETQSITINLNGYIWKSNGRRTLSPGWKAVYKSQEDTESCVLPVINKGDTAFCKNVSLEEKQTTPPPLFTPGTIIPAMLIMMKKFLLLNSFKQWIFTIRSLKQS